MEIIIFCRELCKKHSLEIAPILDASLYMNRSDKKKLNDKSFNWLFLNIRSPYNFAGFNNLSQTLSQIFLFLWSKLIHKYIENFANIFKDFGEFK